MITNTRNKKKNNQKDEKTITKRNRRSRRITTPFSIKDLEDTGTSEIPFLKDDLTRKEGWPRARWAAWIPSEEDKGIRSKHNKD